jgi:predicted Zn-dependent peptidase
MEFRKQVLENGLEIVAECNPKAYSAAVAFFVNTGARDETDEISGVSHFLEHMVFKGTPKRSAADVNRELDEIGSHANAYTSEEHTVYYAAVLPELRGRALDVLADILRPSLREVDFNVEKQVILEEIAKYEDQPPFGASEKCMAVHFQGHPLGRSVLGTAHSVGGLTPEQMRSYFEKRYSPGNIKLVAAGNVDFDQLIEEARQRCGSWQPFDVHRDTPRADRRNEFRVFTKDSASQEYVLQIANGPAAEDSDRFASRLLATILGDESGSRMFWDLIDTGLAEYASTDVGEFQGTGTYMTMLCCSPDQAEGNLRRIDDLYRAAERQGVTQEELARAKSKICAHVVLQSERPASRLFSVGGNWLQRREYRTVREMVQSYQQVTTSDIRAVLEKYPLSDCTTVAVGPLAQLHPPGA